MQLWVPYAHSSQDEQRMSRQYQGNTIPNFSSDDHKFIIPFLKTWLVLLSPLTRLLKLLLKIQNLKNRASVQVFLFDHGFDETTLRMGKGSLASES